MSESHAWIEETFFSWLTKICFDNVHDQKMYEGVLRELHDIPFYWTIWSDENRSGDALAFRQSDFLGFQPDLDLLDQIWLGKWATASPSVLEVLLGMARRWGFYFESPDSLFFGHMFANLGLTRFPGKVLSRTSQDAIRVITDTWMSRQFSPNGVGSPFPIKHPNTDMTRVDIWSQMNAYSREHFQ